MCVPVTKLLTQLICQRTCVDISSRAWVSKSAELVVHSSLMYSDISVYFNSMHFVTLQTVWINYKSETKTVGLFCFQGKGVSSCVEGQCLYVCWNGSSIHVCLTPFHQHLLQKLIASYLVKTFPSNL
jgi:hypothetical protein